jgi:hypothetical protein
MLHVKFTSGHDETCTAEEVNLSAVVSKRTNVLKLAGGKELEWETDEACYLWIAFIQRAEGEM